MATTTNGPQLSVVIPTYNRCDTLRYTLQSLVAQSLPADRYEVIVADDGSSDSTREVVTEFASALRLRYVFLERDEAEVDAVGYCVSRVRNAGARLARAPLLVLLDTGVVAGRGFLAAHLAAHDLEATHGRAVIGYTYGTQKLRPFRPLEELLRTRSPEEVVAAIGDGPRGLDLRHDELHRVDCDLRQHPAPWIFCWTLNLSLRTADYHAAGGLDEDFRGWGYEDIEFAYRLYRNGVQMTASDEAWGVEWPGLGEMATLVASAERNARRLLAKQRRPDVEIYTHTRSRNLLRRYDEEYRAFLSWQDRVREVAVETELAAAQASAAAAAPGRTAVIGCGPEIPPGWPSSVLVDFDADLLCRAAAGTAHLPVHAVGLDTGLTDGAVDLVIITSRLRGLWDRFGARLTAEARRIGGEVQILFPEPEMGHR